MSATTSYSKKQHALIGKILEKENPEIFQKLKHMYIDIKPEETELDKITNYYQEFQNYYTRTTENHRLFIAAMLHLYCPNIFLESLKYRIPKIGKIGLCNMVANTIGMHKRMVSFYSDQIRVWNRVDDVFKEQVSELLKKVRTSEVNG